MFFRRLRLLFIFRIFILKEATSKNQQNRHHESEFLETLSHDQIRELLLRDQTGIIQYVNLSFPAKSRQIYLSLRPVRSTLFKPQFSITVLHKNGSKTPLQTTPSNFFLGNVGGHVERKASALLVKDHWFISFVGEKGHVYSVEPDLEHYDLESTIPSSTMYQIMENHRAELPEANQHRQSKIQSLVYTIQQGIRQATIGTTLTKLASKRRTEEAMSKSIEIKQNHPRATMPNTSSPFCFLYHYLFQRNGRLSDSENRTLTATENQIFCNALTITDRKGWQKLGVEDPLTVASFLVFAYWQVNHMLWSGQTTDAQTSIKIDSIYVCDELPAFERRCEDAHDIFSNRNCVNVSDILYSLGPNQDNKAYCMVQVIAADDVGSFYGGALFPNQQSTANPESHSSADHQASWRPDNSQMSENLEGQLAQRSPRNIGVTTLLGRHQQVSSIGSRARIEPHAPETKGEKRHPRFMRDEHGQICGDGILYPDLEECEPVEMDQTDPCCTQTCRLRPSAACLPARHPCCTPDCRVAPATYMCKKEQHMYKRCVQLAIFCDGVNPTVCTRRKDLNMSVAEFEATMLQVPDSTACSRRGLCSSGECISKCDATTFRPSIDLQDLKLCICPETGHTDIPKEINFTDTCSACCHPGFNFNKSCNVTRDREPDGRLCVYENCSGLGCIRLDGTPDLIYHGVDSAVRNYTLGTLRKSPQKSDLPIFTIVRLTYWFLLMTVCFVFLAVVVKSMYSLRKVKRKRKVRFVETTV
ncbi:hypothetical protein EGW08_017279 [Elysia chlorotica]|uniref:Disintegrin domain-containing protein n=1 Tax=Elysia chlorotica TaxID=188477 RepID=A0A433T086_ELYCH|nr:hypothetical protein EGW08_017279 [Elysia chlorotica]